MNTEKIAVLGTVAIGIIVIFVMLTYSFMNPTSFSPEETITVAYKLDSQGQFRILTPDDEVYYVQNVVVYDQLKPQHSYVVFYNTYKKDGINSARYITAIKEKL